MERYYQNLKKKTGDGLATKIVPKWNDFVSGVHHWRKLVLGEYRLGGKHKLAESRNDGVGLWIFSRDNLSYLFTQD